MGSLGVVRGKVAGVGEEEADVAGLDFGHGGDACREVLIRM